MKKILILLAILGVLGLGLGAAAIVGLIYIGANGPETFVVSGEQMTARQVAVIRELGLLEKGEEIRHFYSDALLDIRDGMYFVTDRRLVLYDDDRAEALLAAPFAAIEGVAAEWSDSIWIDSTFAVTLADGRVWTFPISCENGGDKLVFEHLRERGATGAPDAGR
jgi:hypothetical protein